MQSDAFAVVKVADMHSEMQQVAVDCANAALQKYTHERDISAYIKKEFDRRYHPSWHCIVGRSFGSQVTHDDTHMIHFLMGEVGFLLWRTAPPKAAPGAEADDVES